VNRLLKAFGGALHRALAKSRVAAQIYFALLPMVSQWLPRKTRQQLRNSIHTVRWPEIILRPRTVILGRSTKVRLRPHFDEFDFEVLLGRHLDYERELFEFIEPRIQDYNAVIEIGANVGVFTAFVGATARAQSHALRVFAFEPGRAAYARLIENLQLNGLNDVQTFNCAVGRETDFADFFEPMGHITNGSLSRDFALQFNEEVRCTRTLVIDAQLLDELIADSNRVLIKMDVEGAEPMIVRALEPMLRRVSPDLLIEVLPSTASELNRTTFLREYGYRFSHLTMDGPVERDRFSAGAGRDYFLTRVALSQPITRNRTTALA
jgi:FkbM family methyltransferase